MSAIKDAFKNDKPPTSKTNNKDKPFGGSAGLGIIAGTIADYVKGKGPKKKPPPPPPPPPPAKKGAVGATPGSDIKMKKDVKLIVDKDTAGKMGPTVGHARPNPLAAVIASLGRFS